MNPSSNLYSKLLFSAFLLLATGADAFAPSKSFSRFPAGASSMTLLRAEEEMAASVAESVQAVAESAAPAVVEAVPDAPAVVAPVVQKAAELGDPLLEPVVDADTLALVLGQENYGLAIVLLGEGIWSLSQAPSIDQALKTLVPAAIAAAILGIVSGPMVTSGDVSQIGTGLFVADAVCIIMGLIYLARCLAPYSPSSKEIPALGILVALAGFFTFSENLVVDGYVTLPQLPQLPSIELPSIQLPF
eukprot:CAMPEP_0113648020 /NCGR_PEP_ID=MMETSP0017_2-20120614/25452_1 /TAXON_ID=2856 /ORGANISM="Cylindrotheca closterium" /LENGTH=245 /DNA_ID=CAMNT_0000560177 /DNA_START=116 /DNA_END=853 /DNA_ORIENTATION=- /assembly_acc=CAM_ASM_000147